MTDIARQPQGIPVGGQFAATTHAESLVSLGNQPTAIHRADYSGTLELKNYAYDTLPAWPEDLAKPEVSFDYSNGMLYTRIDVDGSQMRFWTDGDEACNSEDTGEEPWEDMDEEDKDAALEWGKAVHERIDSSMYGISVDTSYQGAVIDAVIAHATEGAAKPAEGPDLKDPDVRDDYVSGMAARVHAMRKDLQRASLIGPSLALKADFPKIHSFELTGDGDYPVIEAAWDVDGQPVDEDYCISANEVFRTSSHDDFDILMMEKNLYVDEAINWRPGQ